MYPHLYPVGAPERVPLPGNRLEFLLSIPEDAKDGAVYQLNWCEPKFDMNFNLLDSLDPNSNCTGTTVVAATLQVTGAKVTPVSFQPGDTFADLSSFGLTTDLWDPGVTVAVKRTIKYTQDMTDFFLDTGDGPVQFSMDQMCDVPIATTLDTVEEWTLENYTGDLHTFHLHVNPVQVDPAMVNSAFGSAPFYQDNIWIPPGTDFSNPMNPNEAKNPGVMKIRFRLTNYVGTTVFHCHVLFHEDHGMMATVSISP